jgi:hypothetical protein
VSLNSFFLVLGSRRWNWVCGALEQGNAPADGKYDPLCPNNKYPELNLRHSTWNFAAEFSIQTYKRQTFVKASKREAGEEAEVPVPFPEGEAKIVACSRQRAAIVKLSPFTPGSASWNRKEFAVTVQELSPIQLC